MFIHSIFPISRQMISSLIMCALTAFITNYVNMKNISVSQCECNFVKNTLYYRMKCLAKRGSRVAIITEWMDQPASPCVSNGQTRLTTQKTTGQLHFTQPRFSTASIASLLCNAPGMLCTAWCCITWRRPSCPMSCAMMSLINEFCLDFYYRDVLLSRIILNSNITNNHDEIAEQIV